jgi:hypothetical protein
VLNDRAEEHLADADIDCAWDLSTEIEVRWEAGGKWAVISTTSAPQYRYSLADHPNTCDYSQLAEAFA